MSKKATINPVEVAIKLGPHALKMAQHERVVWHVTVPHGTKMEDVLEPYYWAHVSQRLNVAKPFDRIELIWEDCSRYAELLVVDAGRQYAKVLVIKDVELGKTEKVAEEIADLEYEVKYVSPTVRWAVIRKADGHRVRENIKTQAEANRELNDFVKAMKA